MSPFAAPSEVMRRSLDPQPRLKVKRLRQLLAEPMVRVRLNRRSLGAPSAGAPGHAAGRKAVVGSVVDDSRVNRGHRTARADPDAATLCGGVLCDQAVVERQRSSRRVQGWRVGRGVDPALEDSSADSSGGVALHDGVIQAERRARSAGLSAEADVGDTTANPLVTLTISQSLIAVHRTVVDG